MSRPKIMLVDDDKKFLKIFCKLIKMNDIDVITYDNPQEALKDRNIVSYDCIVVDLIMPEMNGIEFLREIKKNFYLKNVIVLSAQGTISTAVSAMKEGAYTYLEKPSDIERIVDKIMDIVNDNKSEITFDDCFVGKLNSIEKIKKDIKLVAPTDATVLITGETGTGKELIADMLHNTSRRESKPFIKVNCSALPENLFESELFGYKKGAFSGADKDKKGKLEQANHGTIFLDEIGELPYSVQTKLLRFIQEKEIQSLGSEENIKSDVRIICATNRNLKEEIEKGNFRDDLYYRINVIHIEMPPLRERQNDIEDIFNYYIDFFNIKHNKKVLYPEKNIVELLKQYNWPGNIRELKNSVERLVIFSSNNIIDKTSLPIEILNNCENSNSNDYKITKQNFERNLLIKSLENNNWNVTNTAEALGLSRRTVQIKMKELKIRKPSI